MIELTNRERQSGPLPLGWKFSLPTESKWEYACRGGIKTTHSFCDSLSELSHYCWFSDYAHKRKEEDAHEVGTKKPNDFGLYDMHGNVREWCRDNYEQRLVGGLNPMVENGGSSRVIRGGSWDSAAEGCRSAYRFWLSPGFRFFNIGFRVCLVPNAK